MQVASVTKLGSLEKASACLGITLRGAPRAKPFLCDYFGDSGNCYSAGETPVHGITSAVDATHHCEEVHSMFIIQRYL